MLRIGKQRLDRRLFDDASGVHHGDAVGHLGDDAEVVGDEEEREPEALLQIAQQVENLRLDRDVERGRRLVGDEQRGPAGERDRDQRALAHPARELMRILAHAPFGLRHARPRRAVRSPSAARRARVARPWMRSVSSI